MQVKFWITDRQVISGSEYTADVDDNDLADCATLEGVRQTIAAAIEDAFEERIGWSSEALDPDESRKLWEAAKKAAQEEPHAGK